MRNLHLRNLETYCKGKAFQPKLQSMRNAMIYSRHYGADAGHFKGS